MAAQKETAVRNAGQKFLEKRGWTVIRYDSGRFVGWGLAVKFKNDIMDWVSGGQRFRGTVPCPALPFPRTIGKKGWPDLIAIRHNFEHGWDQVLFLEAKQPGKKPTPEQRKVHAELREQGFCVVWFDCIKDQPGAWSSLAEWYEENRL